MTFDVELMKTQIDRVGKSRLPSPEKIEIFEGMLRDARTKGADEFTCLDIVDAIMWERRMIEDFGVDCPNFHRDCVAPLLQASSGHPILERKPKWWERPLLLLGL